MLKQTFFDWRTKKAQRRIRDVSVFLIFLAFLLQFMFHGAAGLDYEWHWNQVPQFIYQYDSHGGLHPGVMLDGLGITIKIVALAFIGTIVLGFICALLQRSDSVVARLFVRVYIEAIRNTPMLVQIFLIYFVIAPILDIDRFYAGVISLAIFEGSFACEIFRAGIEGVSRGQWEASRALSLSKFDVYRFIVLPQALRLVFPPLTNLTVSLIKDSTLVSVIAVSDLMTEARDAVSTTFMAFEIWFTVAAIYLVLTTSISFFASLAERRFNSREI
jgi:polar amino acid transport system permease protein